MSSRLRLAIILILLFVLAQTLLLARTIRRAGEMHELFPRIIFSRSMIIRPEVDPSLIFDGKLKTAWYDEKLAGDVLSDDSPQAIPPGNMHYIQLELAPTHFPDMPPRKNRLKELHLWTGQNDRNQVCGSPRRIELIFFKQQLVDPDREFRFPGQPVFLARKVVALKNTRAMQKIALDFLPPVEDSPRFPAGVAQLWLRIEIHSLYQAGNSSCAAISELDFVEEYPTHQNIPVQ